MPAKANCERQTDSRQSDPYVLPCFAGITKVCALSDFEVSTQTIQSSLNVKILTLKAHFGNIQGIEPFSWLTDDNHCKDTPLQKVETC